MKKYGLDMTYKELRGDEYASAIFERNIQGLIKRLDQKPEYSGMTIRSIAEKLGGEMPRDAVKRIGEELEELNPDEEGTARRIAEYKEIAAKDQAAAAAGERRQTHHQDAIYPGQVWLDTEGKRIQAHGGGIVREGDWFYWYGENKEHTDGVSRIWTWGIRLYRSKDLMNWEDLGLCIEPCLDDPSSDLFVEKHIDRPHMIYNRKTGKYVCWIKLSGNEACFNVLTADSIRGPFQTVRKHYRPGGYRAGDFDLVVDTSGNKAYLYEDSNHYKVAGFRLSDDFTEAAEEITTQYEALGAPFTREGITVMERKGRKYMLTSGMTGYIPNEADSAESDSWEKPFVSAGDPNVNDETMAAFNSQFTEVIEFPEKDQFLVMADRWVPEVHVDHRMSDLIRRVVASNSDPVHYQATAEEREEFASIPNISGVNTSIADYVWLPASFDADGHVKISWLDSWRP